MDAHFREYLAAIAGMNGLYGIAGEEEDAQRSDPHGRNGSWGRLAAAGPQASGSASPPTMRACSTSSTGLFQAAPLHPAGAGV